MYLLEILQEPSRMVIKFLLCNWVPMHMAVFFYDLRTCSRLLERLHPCARRKTGQWVEGVWISSTEGYCSRDTSRQTAISICLEIDSGEVSATKFKILSVGNGGSKKGKQLMPNFQNSNLSNQNHDLRDRDAWKERAMPGAKITFEIKENVSDGTDALLTLDVSLRLDCGLDGRWEVKCSKVQEVGRDNISPLGVKPTEGFFKPWMLCRCILKMI